MSSRRSREIEEILLNDSKQKLNQIEKEIKEFLSHSNNSSYIVTSESTTLKDIFQHANLIPQEQKYHVITTLASFDEAINSLHEDLQTKAKNAFVFYNNITEYNVRKLAQNIELNDTILDLNNDQIKKIVFGEVFCYFSLESLESFLTHNLAPVTTKNKIQELIQRHQTQLPIKTTLENKVLRHQNEILSSLNKYNSLQSTIEYSQFDNIFDVLLNLYFSLKYDYVNISKQLPEICFSCHDNVISMLHFFYKADQIIEYRIQQGNLNFQKYTDLLKEKLKLMTEEWISFYNQYSNNSTYPIPEGIIELMEYLTHLYYSNIGKNQLDPQTIIKVVNSECFIRILHPRSTILDTLSNFNKKIFIFGRDLSLLEEYDFDIHKYTRISNRMIKGISNVLDSEIIFSCINIILNPDNDMFNYKNEWNENSQNEILQNIYSNNCDHKALSVLRYYPIFYNGLQKYCLTPTNKKYISIFGSPGTGKSTMLIYFLHRWYHKNDLWNGCTAHCIQFILIKYPSRMGNSFLYIERINEDILRIGEFDISEPEIYQFIIGSIEKKISNKSDGKKHYEIELSQLFEFSKKDNSISHISPLSSPEKYMYRPNDNTLIILDEYEKCFNSPKHKLLILNSIEAKHDSEKDNELTVYTFLPKKDEMNQIQKNLNEFYTPSFFQLFEYIGNNIRKCCKLEFNESFINSFHQIIHRLDISDLKTIHLNPSKYLFENKNNIRSLLIQVDAVHPDDNNLKYYSKCSLYEFSHMFSYYHAKLSSNYVYQQLYEIWKINNLQYKISLGYSENFHSGNKTLCVINWENIIHDIFKDKKSIEIDFQQFYYEYDEKLAQEQKQKKENRVTNIKFAKPIIKSTEEEKRYFKFNPNSLMPVVTNNLNDLISSESDYIYYQPSCSNHRGYDSVIKITENLKKKSSTHLFILQMTVSNQHSFHMDAFETIISNKKTKNWQIEFWIVSPIFTDFQVNKIKRNRKKRDQSCPTIIEDEKNFCTYTSNYPFVVAVPRIKKLNKPETASKE
ncbi:hypothetical protein TRFO_29088 [Tritrichomonas foetus]|uniref:Uncharacterized protein n=1 Tax=Tritrichomonas foetus TaxID=1144522 RepID=A0A1J4K1A8_9EUKA|nr:hypothetical protein TRFO_29088 [Tritrichomonas foetus]|eukprot:OHT03534.1 hypothetical protein TRFO_29088 [Tritrichomonas foetus]